MRQVGMEKCRNEVGAEGGCKHKGCAKRQSRGAFAGGASLLRVVSPQEYNVGKFKLVLHIFVFCLRLIVLRLLLVDVRLVP
ncbi:unnamed protein product, partial [Brenthis ino]